MKHALQTGKDGNITITFGQLGTATALELIKTHETTVLGTKTKGRKTPEPTVTEEKDEIDVGEMSRGKDGKKRKARAKFSSNAADDVEEESEEEEETEESEESEEESEDAEESEEEEETEEDDDGEEEEEVSFTTVKKAIDKHGEKKPKAMKALLASFNLKSTAELKAAKKKWAPVWRKIQAQFEKKAK